MDTSYYGLMWDKAINEVITSRHGKEWIDFTAGIAVANAGHSNPSIIKAIEESFARPLFSTYNFPHRYRLQLAKRIRNLFHQSAEDDYIAHFMSSGTEAVEAAIEVALNAKQNRHSVVVSFFNSFHGNTKQSAAISGHNKHSVFINDEGYRVDYIQLPYHHRQEYYGKQFRQDLEDALNAYSLLTSDVVAVVLEPYQGKGVYVAHSVFSQEVAQFCKDNKSLLIVDEIQSGFYRTGSRFAFEQMRIQPDIVCLGKGLTSSLPMSAIVVKEAYMLRDTALDIATTHSANPLSCIAALANISFLESRKFQDTLQDTINNFEEGVREIANAYPGVISYSEVYGMIASLHFSENGQPSTRYAHGVAQVCFENGLMLSMPNGQTSSFLRFTPPLTIRKRYLRQAFKIIDNAIKEVTL
jgi:4-aminobutyrate aminotransferase-like enzyme